MSRIAPETDSEIKAEFSDRYNYFSFMTMVAQSKGRSSQKAVCAYARRMMVVLGYPAETATWSDDQTINYAQNIVMMG
jgi:hypothetical protein